MLFWIIYTVSVILNFLCIRYSIKEDKDYKLQFSDLVIIFIIIFFPIFNSVISLPLFGELVRNEMIRRKLKINWNIIGRKLLLTKIKEEE